MPLYDMQCDQCQQIVEVFCKISERSSQKCRCGGALQVTIARTPAKVYCFREGWYEHISSEPLYISSKSQLRRACKENGCTMDYLE